MWDEFAPPMVDVLVANAGVNRPGALVDVSEADFDTVMATNVKGVFLSLKQVLPSMLDRGCGQIVVTNSVLVRASSQQRVFLFSQSPSAVTECVRRASSIGLQGCYVSVYRPFHSTPRSPRLCTVRMGCTTSFADTTPTDGCRIDSFRHTGPETFHE
jgi:NAD(P)-dependent dehydrogenase (short-subunit alcohol dehydrogenase family)